jgi:predicted dehydrogenase
MDGGKETPVKANKKRKIRYAVVGLGHLAQVAVLPGLDLSRNSKLVALVSGDPKKQTALAKRYDISRVYSYEQYDQCLRDGLDAVYIVLPNHLHREFAVKALNAGVHVLCEKPMAPTEKDCIAMIEAAKEHSCKLMIAYRLHFEKANLEAVRAARRGKLGDLRFFTSTFSQQVAKGNVRLDEPVEKGGGPIYDMGVYCINAARYLFGSEPSHVFATSASRKDKRFRQAEEMTTVMLRFPDDRIATFTASFGAANCSSYTLVGTKGSLTAQPAYDYSIPLQWKLSVGDKVKVRKFARGDQFAAEIEYFSDCIQKDKEPEPSGFEGLADIRIVQAIYKSRDSQKLEAIARIPAKPKPNMKQEIHRPAHAKPKTIDAKSPSGEAA